MCVCIYIYIYIYVHTYSTMLMFISRLSLETKLMSISRVRGPCCGLQCARAVRVAR